MYTFVHFFAFRVHVEARSLLYNNAWRTFILEVDHLSLRVAKACPSLNVFLGFFFLF